MIIRTIFSKKNVLWILIIFIKIVPVFADVPDAVLLNQKTNLVIKNNKLTIFRSYELMINNRKGEEYAEVSIPFSKMNKVSNIQAYIKDKDGIIIKKLKSGDIKERNSFNDASFYEDEFVKEFTLIHNVYPYTICYSYQLQKDAFFYLDDWSPAIKTDVPTLDATLTLDVPRDYHVSYYSQLIDKPKIDTIDDHIITSWKSSYSDQIESEIYSPDRSCYIPNVEIVPENFKYDQVGSLASWKTYGNWLSRLLDGLSDLPEEEKLRINSLIDGVQTTKEKIRILYHYLQDATRYINISIETGGMKPYPASYVAINKYGDCKGLSNYFKSILSYIGVPSYYTNVKAGDKIIIINKDFISQQFNHAILCVPLLNDSLWLDCTSDGPFNYLGTFSQNRTAFLIDKEDSHFTRTPTLSKEDVLESRTVHINSETGNNIIADFHTLSKGTSFEELSDLTRSVSDNKKNRIIRDYFIQSGLELLDYSLIHAQRDSAYITLNYTAKADKLYKKYGNELLISLIPFAVPPFKEPKYRKYPVQLDYPINKIDTIDYQIPVEYQLLTLPKNQSFSTPYGSYKICFLKKNNYIEVLKSFTINAGEYPLSQYTDFFKFIKTVYDIENYTYIVTKKQE